MPRDDWARARNRSIKRQADAADRFAAASSQRERTKKATAAKQKRARSEPPQREDLTTLPTPRVRMPIGPSSMEFVPLFSLPSGTEVEVRTPGSRWAPQTLDNELIFAARQTVGDFAFYVHRGWLIRHRETAVK